MEDPRVEKVLKENGAQFVLRPRLKMADIDVKTSRERQARIGEEVDEDHALSIAISLEDGAEVPPIVVHKEGKKYVIVDGIHRREAYEDLDKVTIPAYEIVEPTTKLLRVLAIELNTGRGKDLTPAQRLLHAKELVMSGSMNQKDAARRLGVDYNKVQRSVWESMTANRLVALGVKGWKGKLKTHSLQRLHAVKDDEIFKGVAQLAVDAGFMVEDVDRLVVEINRHGNSKEEQKKVIERWREDRSDEIVASKTAAKPKKVIDRLIRQTRNFQTLDVDEIKQALPDMPPDAQKRLRIRCQATAQRLVEIAELI